mgnify:CR=1 FL=1
MREMRRKKQELGREECEKIFENGSFGVLALLSADGPYAVPLSYVYDGGKFSVSYTHLTLPTIA